jgi:hypothetical protein
MARREIGNVNMNVNIELDRDVIWILAPCRLLGRWQRCRGTSSGAEDADGRSVSTKCWHVCTVYTAVHTHTNGRENLRSQIWNTFWGALFLCNARHSSANLVTFFSIRQCFSLHKLATGFYFINYTRPFHYNEHSVLLLGRHKIFAFVWCVLSYHLSSDMVFSEILTLPRYAVEWLPMFR